MRVYYGWVLVVALGATETISWGILYYAYTVYLAPMGAELGWSRGDLTGAFSLAVLLAGLAAIPVGRWLDRHGPRLLMTAGSAAASLLTLAWSQVHSLPQLYLIWAAIGLTMSATLYDPAFATASRWFERRRVQALTVITLMAGFASTIFIPLAGWLVQTSGWRESLVTLAIVLAVGTIAPHALLLRRRPEDIGLRPDGAALHPPLRPDGGDPHSPSRPDGGAPQPAANPDRASSQPQLYPDSQLPLRPDGGAPQSARHKREIKAQGQTSQLTPGQVIREPSFRWLTLSLWLATLTTIAVSIHLLPYLRDRGYDPTFAAAVTGSIGAMQVAARLALAPFGTRLTPRLLSLGILATQPVALAVLLLMRSTPGVLLFVVLFGAQRGLATLMRPALIADLYGVARYASIAGVVQFALSLAQAAAPVAAGAAYDALHTYEPVFWSLVGISVLSVLAMLPAKQSRDAPTR